MTLVRDVIGLLHAASAPSRALDQQVALALGWRLDETRIPSASAQQHVWIDSKGREAPRAPYFTTSLHAIYTFAAGVVQFGGVGWEEGKGSARLGDGPAIEASTPEIALCIAVLLEIERNADS